jgi:hypothetical protein
MGDDDEALAIALAIDALDGRMQALLAARLRQYANPAPGRLNGHRASPDAV